MYALPKSYFSYAVYINKFQKQKTKFSNQEISLRENLWNKWIQVRGALLQKPAEESSISFQYTSPVKKTLKNHLPLCKTPLQQTRFVETSKVKLNRESNNTNTSVPSASLNTGKQHSESSRKTSHSTLTNKKPSRSLLEGSLGVVHGQRGLNISSSVLKHPRGPWGPAWQVVQAKNSTIK